MSTSDYGTAWKAAVDARVADCMYIYCHPNTASTARPACTDMALNTAGHGTQPARVRLLCMNTGNCRGGSVKKGCSMA